MWFKLGTISTTDTPGTLVISGVSIPQGAILPGNELSIAGDTTRYEILTVAGNLLTTDPVRDTTATNLSYRIIPTQGFAKQAASRLLDATTAFEEFSDGAFTEGIQVTDGGNNVFSASSLGLILDVLASGNGVQAEPNDDTISKLLVAGSNGLFGRSRRLTSLDNMDLLFSKQEFISALSTTGFPANLPVNANCIGMVIPHDSTAQGLQVMFFLSTGRLFFRAKTSGANINEWQEFVQHTNWQNGTNGRFLTNGRMRICQLDVPVDVTSTQTQTFDLPASFASGTATAHISHIGNPNAALRFNNINRLEVFGSTMAIRLGTAGTSADPASDAERLKITCIGERA